MDSEEIHRRYWNCLLLTETAPLYLCPAIYVFLMACLHEAIEVGWIGLNRITREVRYVICNAHIQMAQRTQATLFGSLQPAVNLLMSWRVLRCLICQYCDVVLLSHFTILTNKKKTRCDSCPLIIHADQSWFTLSRLILTRSALLFTDSQAWIH